MTLLARPQITGASRINFLFAALVGVAVAACGGGASSDPSGSPVAVEAARAAPSASADLLDELQAAADELETFLDTDGDGVDDIEGQVDTDDGTEGAAEGLVDGDGGFIPTLYVDADDLGAILGEMPDPECSSSVAFGGDSCSWTTGDGASALEVEFYRDPNLTSREAFVEHMSTVMSSGSPIDDLGEAAFGGRNPLGSGSRIAVFLGDGVHMWVSISKDGDDQAIYDAALELASKIVATY